MVSMREAEKNIHIMGGIHPYLIICFVFIENCLITARMRMVIVSDIFHECGNCIFSRLGSTINGYDALNLNRDFHCLISLFIPSSTFSILLCHVPMIYIPFI